MIEHMIKPPKSFEDALSRMAERESVFRFDAESFCIVFCAANSDVVQMTSNIASESLANRMASDMRASGCHIFHCVPAGVLVAALYLVWDRKSVEVSK